MEYEEKEKKTEIERWVRIPSKGYCPWCGLSRSHLFELIRENKIKSRTLRKPGNIRGPRLVWLPSVYSYIENAGQVGASI
jgi:rubredoxin